jgi:Plasmid pRiA4b ORF-3-like protein
MSADTIARMKITLDEVEPVVMRRVDVPIDIRLDRLHLTIQAAMGWTNSHLYEICARGTCWGMPDPDGRGDHLNARKTRLIDVLHDVGTKTLKYLYDFGDGWEHTVKIERISEAVPGVAYPTLIDAIGHCPPEDVGGPWGYAEFLEAIQDPEHERHEELSEWVGVPFNPNDSNADQLSKMVARLAKHSSRSKPAAKRSRKA